jgi:hypothetical protein
VNTYKELLLFKNFIINLAYKDTTPSHCGQKYR